MFINGVFEGGGIKGLAYIGVLRFLEERGFQFRYVGGSSIGAVISSLIAVGYNSYQLEEIINDFDLNILTGHKQLKKIPMLIQTVKQKGLYTTENIEKFLTSLYRYKNKLYFSDVKFGDDYLLKVVVTDMKYKKMTIIPDDLKDYGFSLDRFPIAKAVTMSSSIPIVFPPYKLGDSVFVDGGVSNNFPITLFSNSNIPTLGFRLKEKSIIPPNIIQDYQKKIFNISEEYYDFDKYNIIDIDTLGIKATEFEKGIENRLELYHSGYDSMKRFFYQNFRG